MKPDPDPSEPFQEILADDAAHLPALAALAARESRDGRARLRRRLARTALVALVCVGGWQTSRSMRPVPKGADLSRNVIQQTPPARPGNFVLVQTTEEAISKPLPPPSGATPEQKDLLGSARGLPLLLVMDDSGKPAQILVVER
jgi:hypothetical protein